MTVRSQRRDEGMSLVEVLVSVGVFGVLMVIVSAFFISGFGAIRDANALSSVQQDQRNAVLFISTLLRYIDNETEGYVPGAAIVSATASDMRFFTNSGIGSVNGYPYDVSLRGTTNGVNAGVVAEIREPSVSLSGEVTAYTSPAIRVLVRSAAGYEPTLSFRYYTQVKEAGEIVNVESPPPPASDATAFTAWAASVDKILVTITDSGSGLVSQQMVSLVNPL